MSISFSYIQYAHTRTHTYTNTPQSTSCTTVLLAGCVWIQCQSTSVFAGGTISAFYLNAHQQIQYLI